VGYGHGESEQQSVAACAFFPDEVSGDHCLAVPWCDGVQHPEEEGDADREQAEGKGEGLLLD